MKLPKRAPRLYELTSSLSRERFAEVLNQGTVTLVNGKYLHWDELLHRQPPPPLTHEEWWLLIRLGRQAGARRVPLIDTSGRSFSFTFVDPLPELLHNIDLRAGGSIQMPEPVTNPESRDQYYVSSLIEEAITSSQLEGATTTRQVAKEMLRSGRQPRDRSERMILNNFLTMQRIREWKDQPLTKDVVFDIHRCVTEGTLDDASAAGRFRRPDEEIVVESIYGEVVHRPPPAGELDARLRALCAYANSAKEGDAFVHPVLRAMILHFWLAYDHPFVDGNGRSARALFYWSMLRSGYWLAEFVSISQLLVKAPAKYAHAFLHTETDENDLTYFLLHQLDVLRRSIESLHRYIERRSKELRGLEVLLRGAELLNYRQRALVSDALRHPGKHYTIEGHRRSHNVVYETARSDLLDLSGRKLLQAAKRAKKWLFTAPTDLARRLERLR